MNTSRELKLLKRLEWVNGICPECGAAYTYGHNDGCETKALLSSEHVAETPLKEEQGLFTRAEVTSLVQSAVVNAMQRCSCGAKPHHKDCPHG